ncbi:MAG: iron-sulfur cluster assembly scaffold protein [Sulfolobales archaeon]|nr:iron-sulfur cluster assembly scaffold protein [Sulfolobales archaeon]MCX8198998.1 iron-sulfur cluster assembly scaffold protein [Sulfolobales archaeon]MDW8169977.1 iron-sulfur cluster assembly scaffold protein [Desulfurococcaceae archaeon]
MSTRIPLPYGPKVLEIFRNPKNIGRMDDATVIESAGSPACGDMIRLYIKVRSEGDRDVVEKSSFESYGCAANIAAASILTELVNGRSLEEAWRISWKQISDELGGLPPIKYHCSILAVGALKRAIRAYYLNKDKPHWLPQDLTLEEKQVLEEEEMIERYYGSMKAIVDELK